MIWEILGAASRVFQTLRKPDGVWMIVEPFANDKVKDNLNQVGRLFYVAYTIICVAALGAQAGETRMAEVVKRGTGFKHFKRVTHQAKA